MRLPRWLGGASAEDRYVDGWLRGLEPALTTAAGIRVTPETALTVPGISACVQVLSEDIAKVPLVLKRRTESGYEPATEHELYDLLKDGPAPWMSPYRWRKAQAHGVLARGNHYSRVWRHPNGAIRRITPIQANGCTVRWADDGEPFFDATFGTGQERGLTWQDIIHIAYRDSDQGASNGGIIGMTPIDQNRESVALMIAAEKFAGLFFSNGAQPSLVIEMDKRLPNDDVGKRIREGIERVYGGLDNKWKIAILELGMKAKQISIDPEKSQLVETRKLAAEWAAMLFRMPPHKIGILDKATFSNIEQQSIDYVTGPISALARSIESAITIACLTPPERKLYKVEHNLEGLMRGDVLSRYRAYAIGRQWGWLSVNKVLERENENGIGPEGDEYLVPMNMAPIGTDPANDDGNQPTKGRDILGHPTMFRSISPRPDVVLNRPMRRTALLNATGEPVYLD